MLTCLRPSPRPESRAGHSLAVLNRAGYLSFLTHNTMYPKGR
jgi:hypothetical protein